MNTAWQRETPQQRADRLLSEWQRRKHLPPELRLNDNLIHTAQRWTWCAKAWGDDDGFPRTDTRVRS